MKTAWGKKGLIGAADRRAAHSHEGREKKRYPLAIWKRKACRALLTRGGRAPSIKIFPQLSIGEEEKGKKRKKEERKRGEPSLLNSSVLGNGGVALLYLPSTGAKAGGGEKGRRSLREGRKARESPISFHIGRRGRERGKRIWPLKLLCGGMKIVTPRYLIQRRSEDTGRCLSC